MKNKIRNMFDKKVLSLVVVVALLISTVTSTINVNAAVVASTQSTEVTTSNSSFTLNDDTLKIINGSDEIDLQVCCITNYEG